MKDAIIKFMKEYFNLDPVEQPESDEAMVPITFLKDADGNYSKWIGIYSNSFRDDDLVPEILESKGHIDFVKGVDAGKYPLPELWVWHVPEWKLGEATVVAYDEVEDGIVFAIAGGDIDKDKFGIAKAIAESGVDWRMSHTFMTNQRNDMDNSYPEWVVHEVSLLPSGKEANPLTRFGLLSEDNMINPNKRSEMQALLGVTAEDLDLLERTNIGVSEMAKDEREFKAKSEEAEVEAVAETVEAQESKEEAEVVDEVVEAEVEAVVEEEVETEEVEAEEEAVEETEEETTEEAPDMTALDSMFAQMGDLFKAMDERLEEIATSVKELSDSVDERVEEATKELREKQEEQKAEKVSPLGHIASYQNLIGKYMKVEADPTDEEDAALIEAKPKEAAAPSASKFNSSFLGNLIQGSK